MDTWFIAAICAHCRKSIRHGHWALPPDPGRGRRILLDQRDHPEHVALHQVAIGLMYIKPMQPYI